MEKKQNLALDKLDLQKKNGKPVAAELPSTASNRIKWALIFLILIGAVVANYYLRDIAWALQAAAGIILVLVLVACALWTTQGHAAWEFIRASKGELRKVVWPSRAETLQTTFAVVAMVVVTAVILWGFDSLFFWGIGMLTGQR